MVENTTNNKNNNNNTEDNDDNYNNDSDNDQDIHRNHNDNNEENDSCHNNHNKNHKDKNNSDSVANENEEDGTGKTTSKRRIPFPGATPNQQRLAQEIREDIPSSCKYLMSIARSKTKATSLETKTRVLIQKSIKNYSMEKSFN